MDNRKYSYARCKACDSKFYPYWNDKADSFEDLCNPCRRIAETSAGIPVMSDEDHELASYADYLEDTKSASLYADDPYLVAFDEESYASWNLFEGK